MQNLELKAHCHDISLACCLAEKKGGVRQWSRLQIDTYFKVDHGKLKIRQVGNRHAELIAYNRPSTAAAKISHYDIYEIADPEHFKNLLSLALEQTVVVKKQRDLYLWKNVRIHIDKVENLGNFFEFEAVIDSENNKIASQERIDELILHFGIQQNDMINVGYYELLKARI